MKKHKEIQPPPPPPPGATTLAELIASAEAEQKSHEEAANTLAHVLAWLQRRLTGSTAASAIKWSVTLPPSGNIFWTGSYTKRLMQEQP